jgi:hypothetical protein
MIILPILGSLCLLGAAVLAIIMSVIPDQPMWPAVIPLAFSALFFSCWLWG